MNHAKARTAVDELFIGRGHRLGELRAHLDGCLECRAHYDRTARAFRALRGRPEEMTAEELSLFAPAFPEQAPTRGRFPLVWIASLATAAAAALELYVKFEPPEFNARGGTHVAVTTSVRALCSHENPDGPPPITDAIERPCQPGEHLGFVLSAPGQKFVALALVDSAGKVEVIVSGAEGELFGSELEGAPSSPSGWRPGLRVVTVAGQTPIDADLAARCARGQCPASLDRREIPLGQSKP